MNWHTTSLADLELLQKCAVNNDFFANNYGAVNSVLYEKKFSSQIAVEDGWIFEKFSNGGRTFFSFPHNVHGDKTGIKSALSLLKEDAEKSLGAINFENITLEEKDAVLEFFPDSTVTSTPESADYIYLTQKLSGLEGKKLSRKRNHIHQFKNKYPDFTYEPLNAENLSLARQIEEKWLEESTPFALEAGTLADLQIEKEIIFSALDNFEAFSKTSGMSGGILFAAGVPVAFCVASILSSRVTDIHFEKCLYSYVRDGGYAVINNEFAKTVQTEFINREEDLGLEGLRKAKLSYFPEQILEKFSLEIKF